MSIASVFRILTKEDLPAFLDFCSRVEKGFETKALIFAKKSLEQETPEVYIAAEFKGDKMITMLLGYSLNAAWSPETYRNYMPYCVIGSWQTTEISSEPYHKEIDILTILVTDAFEKLGFESLYSVVKVSNKVNINNSRKYLERYHRVRKYAFVVEKLYYHDMYDYEKICSLYKIMSHETCEPNKCIAILKYTLKDEFRK